MAAAHEATPLTRAAAKRAKRGRGRPAREPIFAKPPPAAFIERMEVETGIAESIALQKARGEVFVGRAPFRRLDPLALLFAKGIISRQQKLAGEKYATMYRYLYDIRRPAGAWLRLYEEKLGAVKGINRVRAQGLGGDAGLIFLCDQVCGRDIRPEQLWGDGCAGVVTNALREALTRLGRHFGYIWWDADGLMA